MNQAGLQGAWYSQYSLSNGTNIGCDGDCWTRYAIRTEPNELGINLCCQKCGQPYCGEDVGSLTVNYGGVHPGELTFNFGTYTAPGYYLKVEYGKYIIAFSCGLDASETTNLKIYAYTATPKAPGNFQKIVYDTLTKNNINPANLVPISQNTQCNYLIPR